MIKNGYALLREKIQGAKLKFSLIKAVEIQLE